MFSSFSSFNRGQGLLEYALIISLVVVVVIVVLAALGPVVSTMYEQARALFP